MTYLKNKHFFFLNFSLLVYGAISIVNGLFNRVAMTKFFFDYPIVILLLQIAFMLTSIEIGR